MTDTKHTPLPWHRNITPASKYPTIFSGRNTHVLGLATYQVSSEEVEANAEFIVRACNNHYELLEALERLRNEADLGGLREKAGWDSFLHAADEALAKARGDKTPDAPSCDTCGDALETHNDNRGCETGDGI